MGLRGATGPAGGRRRVLCPSGSTGGTGVSRGRADAGAPVSWLGWGRGAGGAEGRGGHLCYRNMLFF